MTLGTPGRVVRRLAQASVLAAAACAGDDSAAPQPALVSRTPAPDIRPQQLMGLDRDQLAALLGPADFTRDDGPAEIWQFRDPDCLLDVFLYLSPTSGDYRVEHVEARNRSLAGAAEPACVAALLRERRTRASATTG